MADKDQTPPKGELETFIESALNQIVATAESTKARYIYDGIDFDIAVVIGSKQESNTSAPRKGGSGFDIKVARAELDYFTENSPKGVLSKENTSRIKFKNFPRDFETIYRGGSNSSPTADWI